MCIWHLLFTCGNLPFWNAENVVSPEVTLLSRTPFIFVISILFCLERVFDTYNLLTVICIFELLKNFYIRMDGWRDGMRWDGMGEKCPPIFFVLFTSKDRYVCTCNILIKNCHRHSYGFHSLISLGGRGWWSKKLGEGIPIQGSWDFMKKL